MKFKSSDQHQAHRYQNTKVLLSTLSELDYFYNNVDIEKGIQAIANLSKEERDAMYEILNMIFKVCNNLKEYDDKWI